MRKFYATNANNMLLRRFSKCSTPVKCYLYKICCSNLYNNSIPTTMPQEESPKNTRVET